MSDESPPEADRAEGAPHPRENHAAVRSQGCRGPRSLASLGNDRMHHAWLLTGPRGVGKATLAWAMAADPAGTKRAARLIKTVPLRQALTCPQITPLPAVSPRLSDPGCLLIRRAWDPDRKRLKNWITVDEIRRLNRFLGLTATDGGGCRVVIVDAADDMKPVRRKRPPQAAGRTSGKHGSHPDQPTSRRDFFQRSGRVAAS